MPTKVTFKLPPYVKARDRVSGLEGTVTTRCVRINGCRQYSLDPKVHDKDPGKVPDGVFIDFENLESIEGETPLPVNYSEEYEFQYDVGDEVKSRINGFRGIATIARIDPNRCELYLIEGKKLDKEGKKVQVWHFAQEIEKVSEGLNKARTPLFSQHQPALAKVNTGCRPMIKERI